MAAIAAEAVPAGAQTHLNDVVRIRMYQGRDRGPEQTDRFSAKYRIGRDGRVSIANISGDIVVTGGSGEEVSVDAVKRGRGDRSQLGNVVLAWEAVPDARDENAVEACITG